MTKWNPSEVRARARQYGDPRRSVDRDGDLHAGLGAAMGLMNCYEVDARLQLELG